MGHGDPKLRWAGKPVTRKLELLEGNCCSVLIVRVKVLADRAASNALATSGLIVVLYTLLTPGHRQFPECSRHNLGLKLGQEGVNGAVPQPLSDGLTASFTRPVTMLYYTHHSCSMPKLRGQHLPYFRQVN
ncbi:hypothetical protein J3A83DRAFT_4190641 [Scleroderma citrinum]